MKPGDDTEGLQIALMRWATRSHSSAGRGDAMLWIVTWCDYGIGAILALIATGDLTPWWFLATPVLACVGGFLRAADRARKA